MFWEENLMFSTLQNVLSWSHLNSEHVGKGYGFKGSLRLKKKENKKPQGEKQQQGRTSKQLWMLQSIF